MHIDWSPIIQGTLMLLIQLLLPVLLGYAVVWVNAQIKATKAKMSADQIALVRSLVASFVLAAEQSGLAGTIRNIGSEKKAYVLALIRNELAARNISIDVDTLDAMVEAAVNDAFGHIETVSTNPLSAPAIG